MMMEVAAHSLFSGPDRGLLENVVLWHDNGVVTSISETAPSTSPRSLVLPAFVNAHDHARAPASSFGAVSMPLESWILRSALGTPVDPYLTAASALARSARAGCAAMMIHYTRPSGTMPLVEEAKAIARAASDVGIRIAFAIAVRYLSDIGFVSERLTLAHCIHARPDELEMIAASGARIVTNFSSNMHLRSGLAPIAAAHQCGCGIAVGVDGLALDEDDDALREMRLVQMFHGGLGFKRTWTPAEFFALAVANGRKGTGAPGTGALLPGAPAAFGTIDLDRLDRDQIMPVDPIELLFARGNASLLRDVVVGGRTIVSEGRCLGVDLPAIEAELRGIYRANAGKLGSFQRSWPPLSASLQNWFEAQLDCR